MKPKHLVWGIILLLTVQAQTPPSASDLAGTRWTLQSYGPEDTQQNILAEAPITLEFRADGALSGLAGCNSYRGKVIVEGDALTVSPLITTRKACAETVMTQETNYLRLLQDATTFERTDSTLILLSGKERLEFSLQK
jgi:heat shock protein HslJ